MSGSITEFHRSLVEHVAKNADPAGEAAELVGAACTILAATVGREVAASVIEACRDRLFGESRLPMHHGLDRPRGRA